MDTQSATPDGPGLRSHLAQFLLLVVVNLFVGGMVGLERTILPLIAEADFAIASKAAAIAFIATFGISKAFTNALAGVLADRWGRRRVLLIGWLFGLPVPALIIAAPSWSWILGANVLLGINQALTWSMTVVMKVDIAGERQRGLALGFNEFAGYSGLAGIALATGLTASQFGLRPEPMFIGFVLVFVGLALSLFVRETQPSRIITQLEEDRRRSLREVFRHSTWTHPTLAVASFGGLMINLKDGTLWGLLPLFLESRGMSIPEIGTIVALYPAVWGITQLGFGPLSDRVGRKILIVIGFLAQALGIVGFLFLKSYEGYLLAGAVIGVGTAMAYPTLLALVSDVSEPAWRASALGMYRFWRDSGFAFGAIGAGLVADALGIPGALAIVAALVGMASAAVAMRVKLPEN